MAACFKRDFDGIAIRLNNASRWAEHVNGEAIGLIREITTTNFNRMQIIIKGEEDLLALPLFMYSPNGWTVFYGQPNEGLVVVEIDSNIRKKAKLIFNKVFLP